MRISTAQLQHNAVNALLDQQVKLGKTQLEVASGKKFLSPADNPPAAVAALEYTRQLSALDQYKTNIDRVTSALTTEEATLGSMQEQLQRLHELAIVAAGSGANRPGIAYEVRGLQQALLNMSNTRDENGEYLFSGFQSQTPTYTDAGGGVFTYNGDQGQRLIEISPSTRVAAADAGARIFGGLSAAGGGVTDVFAIVSAFATALEANTFNANTLTDLDTAMTSVVGARAVTGARLNMLDEYKNLNSAFTLDTKSNLSDVQDLDYAEAVSRLNLQLAGLQAAQESFVRIQNLSLFNLLR